MRKYRVILFLVIVSFSVSSCEFFTALFSPRLTGTWVQETYWTTPMDLDFRVEITFDRNGDYEQLFYVRETTTWELWTGSFRGTYAVDGDIITITLTSGYVVLTETPVTGEWQSAPSPLEGTAQFSISAGILSLTMDYDGNQIYDDSVLFSDTFPGGAGPTTDITYVLERL